MSERPDFVAIGRIMKPRGIRGEAFLLPLTDFPERFDDLSSVRIALANGGCAELDISYVRQYGKRLAVKFEGIDTPEDLVRYRGALIQVPRDAVHPLPDEDTFYVFELIGLPVQTASGESIGTVVDVLSYPGNDLYVIDRNGEEVLIPAVREIVTIDRDAGLMVVQEIEGLL